MKAEDFLYKYVHNEITVTVAESEKQIVKAMEEYANQKTQSQQQEIEGLKEKLYHAEMECGFAEIKVESLQSELSRIREGVGTLHAYSFSDAPDLSYPLPYYSKKDVDNLIGKGE